MTTLVLGTSHLKVGEKESNLSQSMQDREISPSGQEFQSGTRKASLVEIPTHRVRLLNPAWTLVMDSYSPLRELFRRTTADFSFHISVVFALIRWRVPELSFFFSINKNWFCQSRHSYVNIWTANFKSYPYMEEYYRFNEAYIGRIVPQTSFMCL